VGQQSTHRAQSRIRVTQALDRVRQAARQRKKERFTALLHHINVDTLKTAFYALKRKAAPGVDGELRLEDLHGRVHRGAYTGTQGPLSVPRGIHMSIGAPGGRR
jgi:RNA-directed DNA polymerase